MLVFFREGLHYIYMTFFHTLTLVVDTEVLPKKKAMIVFLKTYLLACILIVVLLALAGVISEMASYPFDWGSAYKKLFSFFILCLLVGLIAGLTVGGGGGLVFGVGWLVFGMVSGLAFGAIGGLSDGLVVGLAIGFCFGLFGGMVGNISKWFTVALVIGLMGWVLKGSVTAFYYFLAFTPTYFIVYFRPFYVFPHMLQYWRANHVRNPFSVFRHSPVYWDQMIRMPLPFLQDWLVALVGRERDKGLAEIFFIVGERPFQRKAAFRALVLVTGGDLRRVQSVMSLVELNEALAVFPIDNKALPIGLQDVHKRLNGVADLAADYQNRQTRVGQLNVLAELHKKMGEFQTVMKLTAAPVGTTFEPLAAQWLKMIEAEQEKLRQQASFNELPNPYVAGSPLQERDNTLFVGRRDILLAIEQYILNTGQSPSLLLYGRRRTGKSSTLLNLPRSRFEPVYIDCQDAKWHESDQAFCYNLASDLFKVLFQGDSVKGLRQPQIEQFEKNAFTQLDQFLTTAQKLAQERSKRILLAFDEYEELETSILNGDISEKVLGKLRNLIQHSKSIVVLVSGSHRFEELTRLNWANYLINTRTLELSYLDADPARELLTKPVPELHYEDGVVDAIIHVTHCQPYLLQAVASELINYLNSKQQTTATPDDLNTALDKTLVSASAYFSDTWRKDNSSEEQQVMRALATGNANTLLADATLQPAIQSLIRKEIVEHNNGGYRLAVELFARWIVKNQV